MPETYKEPFLDYYRKHNISPVSQDIEDLKKHFDRRGSLYRHCGIPPGFIKDKRVLEFGPGSGHNAVFTNSLGPKKYVLVDGNPKGITNTRNLINSYNEASNCIFHEVKIQEFSSDDVFDLVLCEGVIPAQVDPESYIQIVSNYVDKSGILLITCSDYASILSEVLRKVLASLLLNGDAVSVNKKDAKTKLKILSPFFSRHLNTLEGMSRPVDDWIYDNIMQPTLGGRFSIEDAVHAIPENFSVYGVSPHFFNDWRWYKDIHGNQKKFNELMVASFLSNVHNLLDYREVFPPIEPGEGRVLYRQCQLIWELATLAHRSPKQDNLVALCEALKPIQMYCADFSKRIPIAIDEFIFAVEEFNKTRSIPDRFNTFASWFGKGQQYLSFIRDD